MSELKVYRISGIEFDSQFYHKSEADKVIARHKYKRCLAMARMCNEKWLVHNSAEIPTKLGFYDKWEKRWLELAEEPTWAKFLQLIHKEAK